MKPYYEQAGITIYHGDCREILPLLATGAAGLVLTDPPFNAGLEYGDGFDDRRPWPEYTAWLSGIVGECERVANGPVMVFVSVRGLIEMLRVHPPVWVGGWHRPSAGPQVGNRGFYPSWEPCLIYGKTWQDDGRVPSWAMRDMWRHEPARAGSSHPCPKPVGLMLRILSKFTNAAVLDPFMGSGTTLRAAKDAGLPAIGIELEERYCELAAKRLSQGVLFGVEESR